MKLTKSQLRSIIREEMTIALGEVFGGVASVGGVRPSRPRSTSGVVPAIKLSPGTIAVNSKDYYKLEDLLGGAEGYQELLKDVYEYADRELQGLEGRRVVLSSPGRPALRITLYGGSEDQQAFFNKINSMLRGTG